MSNFEIRSFFARGFTPSITMARFLVISDLFPTVKRPVNAPFIAERMAAHAEANHQVDRIDLRLRPNQPLRMLLSRAGRDVEDPPPGAASFVGINSSILGYIRLKRARTRIPWAVDLADKIESICSIGDYDAIHAHGMYRVGAGLVASILSERHNVPFGVSVHGSDIYNGMASYQADFIRAFSTARSVMYVSPALQEHAIELGAPQEGNLVTGNGVDLDLFTLGGQHRKPEVLYVGHLALVKGADRLPEVFRQIRKSIPDATMSVIGVGPLYDQIASESDDLPFTLLGPQSRVEVAAAMRRAAVLVLPSRSEGWPTVINEALASGTPVAATDVGGVRQALGHDDWVVPSEPSPEAPLAEVTTRLLTEDHDRTKLRAQAGQFSWTSIARCERLALGIT